MSYRPSTGDGGVWTHVETVTVSNQATVEMDLSGSHSVYVIHIDNLVPVTDGTFLYMRYSVDGGSTFLSGASDYSWLVKALAPSLNTQNSAADTEIQLTHSGSLSNQNMGNATDESLNGFIHIHNAKQTTKAIIATSQLAQLAEDNNFIQPYGRSALIANIDEVDAVQLFASSGNLDTGRISLYGVDTA